MNDITYADMAAAVSRSHRLALDVALQLHQAGNDAAVDDIEEHINALNAAVATLNGLAKNAGETAA